jgi:hypothetical protein
MVMSPKKIAILSTLSLSVLAACGGDDPAGPQRDTAVTRGAITGTSSGGIVVNGVQVGTGGASVKIDDNPSTSDQLKPGQVVTVKGAFDDRSGNATEIELEHAVKGRVRGVDPAAGTIDVGGQTVRVDDTTHFEDNVNRINGVTAGERVVVSGVPDDKGGLRASRVDDSPGSSEDFELKGFVSDLGAAGFTLKVSPDALTSYTVTLAGATLPAGIQNGSYVEVRSATGIGAGNTLAATSISLEDRIGGQRRVNVEVEGIVTSGSSTSFVVEGITVVTSSSTRWQFGIPADLVPGVKVEAEGHLDDAGVIQATKVSYRAVVRLEGPVANLSGNSFEVLGFQVSRSDLTDERVGVANGATVEVRGYPDNSGTKLVASRIDEGNGNGRLFLQGVATAKDEGAGTVTILGYTVQANGASFHDSRGTSGSGNDVVISRSAFFGAIEPGRTIVKARGRDESALSGKTLTAEEAELEGDE